MRFYKSDCLEHIGFDFYCDIANNIVKARKDMGLTQKELAKLALRNTVWWELRT